jgi:fucose 4-O-acetylase-like acetyltransferase
MPLFMLLSGFIITSQLGNTFPGYLKKYSLRLIVPFFVWAAVSYGVYHFYRDVSLPAYLLSVAKAPDHGMWFLWVLFLNSVMLFSVLKLVRVRNWVRWENYFIIASIILARAASTNLFGLSEFRLYYPYYAAGFFAYKYYDVLKAKRKIFYAAAIIGFPALILGWRRNEFPTFYPVLVNVFGDTGIARLIVSIYKYVVAFLGMALLSFLLERVRNNRFYLFLCWVGTLTLDIYVCHGYFLFRFGEGIWQYLSAAAIAFVCSMALTLLLLKRFKITRMLFLGQSR